MSQQVWDTIDPFTTNGVQLVTILTQFKDAVISGMSGPTRPTEIDPGGMWLDTSLGAAPNYTWVLKLWTGVVDLTLFEMNTNSGSITVPGTSNSFEILKVSDDTLGAMLYFEKQRVSGGVLAGDNIGTFSFNGNDDTDTIRHTASLDIIAANNFTSSAFGSYYSFKAVASGGTSKVEFMTAGADVVEMKTLLKVISLQYQSQNVVGGVTINSLNADYAIVQITDSGPAAPTILNGINPTGKSKVIYVNNSSTQLLTVNHNNGSGVAGGKLLLTEAFLEIPVNGTISFYLDSVAGAWKMLSASGSGGSDDGKVDKIVTANQVYATDGAGAQTSYTHSTGTTADTIAKRTAQGSLKAVTLADGDTNATADDLTTRDYVTDAIATAVAGIAGGVMTVANIAARDAIVSGDRYDGLIVYCVTEKLNFQLRGGITNGDWKPLFDNGYSSQTITASGQALTISAYLTDQTIQLVNTTGLWTLNAAPFGSTTPLPGTKVTVIGPNTDTYLTTIPGSDGATAKNVNGYTQMFGSTTVATYVYSSVKDQWLIK